MKVPLLLALILLLIPSTYADEFPSVTVTISPHLLLFGVLFSALVIIAIYRRRKK